ncbi:hypothetical protein C1H46_009135 [Malus baccata]|uniref:Uncharacterized protein n=1 Tax=Malus baccata TaxID=106549 RepID=A0A540N2I7_MALBA|nr:hypothetical protein C1H46_009135 [Malus baccata]
MNSMRSHHLLSAKRRRTQQGFDVFLNLIINSDGEFNADGLDRFVKEVKLTECGLSYAVVAVMGPQSSGTQKSHEFSFQTLTENGTWCY